MYEYSRAMYEARERERRREREAAAERIANHARAGRQRRRWPRLIEALRFPRPDQRDELEAEVGIER